MNEDEVLDYMNQLENENAELSEFSEKYSALASFLADYDFLKDKNKLSQKDIAKKMGTTQSAVSRIERFKTNPSYLQLKKMAEAVGGKLCLSPMADFSITLPIDLQEKVKSVAQKKNESVSEYLNNCIRNAVLSDYEELNVEFSNGYFYSDRATQSVQQFSEEIKDSSSAECNFDILAA